MWENGENLLHSVSMEWDSRKEIRAFCRYMLSYIPAEDLSLHSYQTIHVINEPV